MGHALNKSIKDFITRSYAMRGYYTPYIPGWDNHGMPIESAIIKEQKLNHKAMSVADFRSACEAYAEKYIHRQMDGFKRLGVIADWEHPYKTMNRGFEADEIRIFGRMYKNGHIYKGLKPVYWCAKDETALAEAEIEYQDDPCTTVYVKFPMKDDMGKAFPYRPQQALLRHLDDDHMDAARQPRYCPAPDEAYALVKAPNGEIYIMAEALTEKVMKIGGFDSYEIIETHPGRFFENMLAQHPFLTSPRACCWPTMSRWTPARAACTLPPASARTTIRPVCATASRWSCPWTIRAATPTMPVSTPG